MEEGELVVVTGKLDTRVRQKNQGELVIGTLFLIDPHGIAWVILPDFDFWRGPVREICPAIQQLPIPEK